MDLKSSAKKNMARVLVCVAMLSGIGLLLSHPQNLSELAHPH
jgi:hypothetical protein